MTRVSIRGRLAASAKTEGVNITSIRYPGEDIGIWTILRAISMVIGALGFLMEGLKGNILLAILYLFIFLVASPYVDLKRRENTGTGFTRGAKTLFILGLPFLISYIRNET